MANKILQSNFPWTYTLNTFTATDVHPHHLFNLNSSTLVTKKVSHTILEKKTVSFKNIYLAYIKNSCFGNQGTTLFGLVSYNPGL